MIESTDKQSHSFKDVCLCTKTYTITLSWKDEAQMQSVNYPRSSMKLKIVSNTFRLTTHID